MKQTLMTMGEYLLIFGIIAFIIFFLADSRAPTSRPDGAEYSNGLE